MRAQPEDRWSSGSDYELYVGRWSKLVAREFLAWIDVPGGMRWLDVGCGTGALSQTILDLTNPKQVTGIDMSEAYAAFARDRNSDERASFKVGDAQHLRFETGSFDAAVSGLMLNFVPRPQLAVAELARVVRPGGVIAAYVWDYAEGMEFMLMFWDVAIELDPTALDLDEARRFALARPEPLRELFQGVGAGGVSVRAIDIPTVFRNFDDFWHPFTGGQGSAPSYVQTLSPPKQDRLRDALSVRLPVSSDGSIHMTARAWAVWAR